MCNQKFLDRLADNFINWAREGGTVEAQKRAVLFDRPTQRLISALLTARSDASARRK